MHALYRSQDFPYAEGQPGQSRWQLFLLVSVAHLLLFLLWPSINRYKSEVIHPLSFLVRMLEAPKQVQSVAAPVRQAPAVNRSTRLAENQAGDKPAPTDVPPAMATHEVVSPSFDSLNSVTPTAPVEAAGSGISVQRDIRQVLKEVQRELPNRNLTETKPDKSSFLAFQKNVSEAARPRGTTFQNFVLPDGSAMTKVTTSLGSYCVIGAKLGWDFSKAPGVKTVSCGSY
ncbi:hypothetical protein [Undibacterium sp. TJN19]|uniref:hypothetical protein n=1 Tax=Undibacterium sp. TJN19 TaxID=3413055 RepID=UPI003BF3440A